MPDITLGVWGPTGVERVALRHILRVEPLPDDDECEVLYTDATTGRKRLGRVASSATVVRKILADMAE